VQLSHQSYGWSNKLFRVVEQKISRTGQTKITLLEENTAIYAWDNSEAAAVTPARRRSTTRQFADPDVGIRERKVTTGNMLTDVLFSRKWTLSAGALSAAANATSGYAQGVEPYYCELSPSTSLVRSALSEKGAGQRRPEVLFRRSGRSAERRSARARGSTSAASGSAADGTTVVGSFTEGTQQTPSQPDRGRAAEGVNWSGTAPSTLITCS
jgi:hypothetical protein